MPVHCASCGSQLGPAGLPKRLRMAAVGSGQLSLQEREDLLEAAQGLENEPAVAKPEKWTTPRTRYRDPQPHRGPMHRCVVGVNICTYCGFNEHEQGCEV